MAAAGNAGRACPPGHLEATGDQTMWTETHSGLHDEPDFHVSSWSGVMAKPAEQPQEDPGGPRRTQTAGGVNIATKVWKAAINCAALRGRCNTATNVPQPPHREGKLQVWGRLGAARR